MKGIFRRLLAFALTAIIVTTVVYVPVSAENMSDYSSAVDIMKSLGLGKALDLPNVTASVRRDVFVAAIVDLFDGEGIVADCGFTDIENSEYKAEIVTAVQMGIVSGNTDTFNPDGRITYAEAVTMVIRALGYSYIARAQGGFPIGYIIEANALGLNNGIELSGSDILSTGAAARLLLNTGRTQMMEQQTYGTEDWVYAKEGTPFWVYHNIGYGTGVLSGNEFTTLSSVEGLSVNTVRIGDFAGEMYMSNAVYDYIGYAVDYYYQYDKTKNKSMVKYIAPNDWENDITEIKAEDIIRYSPGKLSYGVNNKQREISFPKNTPVIYNGRLTLDYTDDSGKSYFEPSEGYVRFINNDRVGDIDVVVICSLVDYVIKKPTEDNMISDKYDKNKVLDFGELEGYTFAGIITDSKGNELRCDELAENDVLTVAKSLDGEIIRAVMHREKNDGTLTSVSKNNNRKTVVIDSKVYTVSASFNLTNAKLNTYGVFYLNAKGEIAGFDAEGSMSDLGFYFTAKESDSFGEVVVRIMTAAGVKKNVPLAKNGTVDGKRWKSGKNFIELMNSIGDYQLMVYKLNGKGELFYIDTADEQETGEGKLRKKGQKLTNATYYTETRLFSTKILLSNRTNIFYAPIGNLKENEDYYYAPTFDSILQGAYNVQEYTLGSKNNVAECVVIDTPDKKTLTANSDFMLITDIVQTMDLDGDISWQIKGWNREKEYTAFLADDFYTRYDSLADSDPRKKYLVSDLSTLQVGDFIKIAINLNGEISEISVMYYAGEDKLGPFYVAPGAIGASQAYGNSAYAVFGELLTNDGNSLSIAVNNPAASGQADHTFVLFNNFTKAFRMKYNEHKNEWSVEVVEEYPAAFEDYTHNGKSNKILVYCYNIQPRMVLFYEED